MYAAKCSGTRRLMYKTKIDWLRWWISRLLWARQLRLGGGHGRHVDWMPVECMECGWRGPERWLRHGYENDGTGEDVEAVDYCPRCGSEA